jgi:hypothetical protein
MFYLKLFSYYMFKYYFYYFLKNNRVKIEPSILYKC